ncbi:AAA family ATPase, partial [Staphylococcus aureus]
LGAECTGKSTLAAALARHCNAGLVSEYLREWCDAHGRTPLRHEQAHIAAEQAARIDAAARQHALVFCDTTPLITALCSEHYF